MTDAERKMAEFIKRSCEMSGCGECDSTTCTILFGNRSPCAMSVEDVVKAFKEE